MTFDCSNDVSLAIRMTKSSIILTIILFCGGAFAQPYKTVKAYKPYKWMFGLHWSAVEDDGEKLSGMFDITNNWSEILPYPSRLTVDRYFNLGWSAEAALSYAKYKPENQFNDSTHAEGINVSFDASARYSFYNFYAPKARWVEPYVIMGVGYTYRDGLAEQHVPTVNLGAGVNFWVHKQVGLQFASRAKLGVWPGFWDEVSEANYFQHSVGILYRTKDKKNFVTSRKKQHTWTKKNYKFKRKGGH